MDSEVSKRGTDPAAFFWLGSVLTTYGDKLSPSAMAIIADRIARPSAAGAAVEYEFEVWQGDAWQAGGSTTTLEDAQTEAAHYAAMYGQDGPVEVKFYEKRALTGAQP